MKEKRPTNKERADLVGKVSKHQDLPRFNRFVDEILQKRTASQKTDGGLSNE